MLTFLSGSPELGGPLHIAVSSAWASPEISATTINTLDWPVYSGHLSNEGQIFLAHAGVTTIDRFHIRGLSKLFEETITATYVTLGFNPTPSPPWIANS